MAFPRLVAVIALLGSALSAPGQNIVQNPSFEAPDIGGGFVGVGPGQALGPWTVAGSGIDLINNFWQAADGRQSLDMNRDAAGSVFQDLPTNAGQRYRITLQLAGNPFGFDDKTLDVKWDGTVAGHLVFDQSNQTASDMGWVEHSFTVSATATTTRLELVSTTGSMNGTQGITAFYGPAVDLVSVTPIESMPGDMNCDGIVSVSDIGPFVLALTNPAGYAAQFPDCDINNGDVNGDTHVSVGDIGGFVALLTGV